MPRAMRWDFAWEGTGMPQPRRRTLTGAVRADWLRLSRTRAIGPTTFFHLLDRYGAAADVLADLPTLAKKAGEEAEIKEAGRSAYRKCGRRCAGHAGHFRPQLR